ncbi:MAG: hypothetical protein IJW54_04485 [Clostridia bacterium]|nr:hypothetical protein [Clostridia bacterium]
MRYNANWIWLDSSKYSKYEYNDERGEFCTAELKNSYVAIKKTKIRACADSRYLLFVNDKFVGRGPSSPGSDFLYGTVDCSYFDEYEIEETGKIEIRLIVTSLSSVLTDRTFGLSGAYVEVFEDGKLILPCDESWEIRQLTERKSVLFTDYTEKPADFEKAKITKSTLKLERCPLEALEEKRIEPIETKTLKNGAMWLNFDKNYSAYPVISIKSNGTKSKITVKSCEMGDTGKIVETIITDRDIIHYTPRLRCVGEMEILIEGDAKIEEAYLIFASYPIKNEARFECSNKLLNEIYDVCMHTLKICRQTLHLDSPTHQEHLACTGDYYIQALIEYLNIYDPTLTEHDIYRTSKILECQDGRLFHTTYSLIYPIWIYDYYMHTGKIELIKKCEKSLRLLLKRFEAYVSKENDLIEYAPDYMFVDWVIASKEKDEFLDGSKMMSHGKMEGYSLHHPPKSLGQSVLCMFYYEMLNKTSKLFLLLNDEKTADECLKKAEKIKKSINKHLFDNEKGLYFGGLNTKNHVTENEWLPKNNNVRYYLKQANTLAVLYNICPEEKKREILSFVLKDLNKYEMQPYFYHFLLDALCKNDMFEKYGLELIKKYESLLNKCKKGLSEAWENMDCDYSHAWGASPAYYLKKALSGFEVIEAGCKKIKLSPRLFDLSFANYELSTPYGKIEICHKKGEDVVIKVPDDIEIV